MHAVVTYVIHRARKASKGEEGKARNHSIDEMKNQVKKELNHLAARRMHWHVMQKNAGGFGEAWIEPGLAKRTPDGHVHVTVLDDTHDAPPQPQRAPRWQDQWP